MMVLKSRTEVLPVMSQTPAVHTGHVHTVNENLATGRLVKTQEQLEKGAFPRSGVASEKGHGAFAELRGDIDERLLAVVETFGYAMEFYLRHSGSCVPGHTFLLIWKECRHEGFRFEGT